jgi:predicted nucleic acid-binding protein
VPLILKQDATRALESVYSEDPEIAAWWAAELECVSAVARLEREGLVSSGSATSALRRLDELRAAWREVEPVEAVRRTARRLLRVHPLRAADSLQLAAAVVAAEGDPASLEFVTLDARLAGAAEREGFRLLDAGQQQV